MKKRRNDLKLNLGSGDFSKSGYINVDYLPHFKPDILHDLNTFPYPFKDNTFSLVEADHVLEHLENPFMVMKEIHRITSNSAIVRIKVPHFSRGFTHPEHKSGFDISFPYYFRPDFKAGYQGFEFVCTQTKFTWFAQPYLKKLVLSRFFFLIASGFNIIISFLANLSPFFCSRIWCFFVGGFEEVAFTFVTKKEFN